MGVHTKVEHLPPLWAALLPIAILIAMLSAAVMLFGSDATSGASQIALLATAGAAAAIAVALGQRWADIEEAMIDSITMALRAIVILLMVGALLGTWVVGGIVPTLISFGLDLLSANHFYVASCLICAIVSLSTGSSWTTAGTVGVALIGVAHALNLSPAIAAGAIISGAYFGDKISPLSDSTNLTAGVTGADLFAHVRNMIWTTAPSLTIALILFAVMDTTSSTVEARDLASISEAIAAQFDTSWPMLLPLVLVLGLAAVRCPPLPTLAIGVLLGAAFAVVYQSDAMARYGASLGGGELSAAKAIWASAFDGYRGNTGNATLDDLLSRGGMSSMLMTVWLIISA